MLEVVSMIASHLDVDGHQNFDVPLPRVRALPPPTPPPSRLSAAAAAAAGIPVPDVRRLIGARR